MHVSSEKSPRQRARMDGRRATLTQRSRHDGAGVFSPRTTEMFHISLKSHLNLVANPDCFRNICSNLNRESNQRHLANQLIKHQSNQLRVLMNIPMTVKTSHLHTCTLPVKPQKCPDINNSPTPLIGCFFDLQKELSAEDGQRR